MTRIFVSSRISLAVAKLLPIQINTTFNLNWSELGLELTGHVFTHTLIELFRESKLSSKNFSLDLMEIERTGVKCYLQCLSSIKICHQKDQTI